MNIVEFVNSIDPKEVSHSQILPTMDQIKEAEEKLGVKFADDYIECLLNYGMLKIGCIALMGISYCDMSSELSINWYRNYDIIYQTLWMKSLDCHAHVPKNMYLIEDLCIDLFLVWQDETGAVYETLPWSGPKKAADSLVEYLQKVYKDEVESNRKVFG